MKNPLMDKEFLKQLDQTKEKEIFAKIILLDFNENSLSQIEGRVTQGSINIDGASAVRRTCSLSLIAKDIDVNDYYWGLNSKFKLEIGINNTINLDYPNIIWFPQGVYLFTSFNTSQTTNNYNISISGKDKMCLLNGDIAGSLPSSIDFGTLEYYEYTYSKMIFTDNIVYEKNKYYLLKDGVYELSVGDYNSTLTYYKKEQIIKYEQIPLKEIIKNAVNVYGNEPIHNIIINDLDEYGIELLEYRGDVPLYMLREVNSDSIKNMTMDGSKIYYKSDNTTIRLDKIEHYDNLIDIKQESATQIKADINSDIYYTVIKLEYGNTAGYRLSDLIYAGELIANIGESLTSILDKIKNMLGNFEYFYDIDGRFIFQKKKVYANNSWNSIVNTQDDIYVEDAAYTSAITYSFEDSNLVTSFQNNPSLNELKNDYSVWGKRKSVSGTELLVHMRYAIDTKPSYYKNYNGSFYTIEKKPDEELREEIKNEILDALNKYNKLKNPAGLSEDWWEVCDWANYYKQLTGEFPSGRLDLYCRDGTYIDLNALFPPGVVWPNRQPIYMFDVAANGTLEYTGHGVNCSHYYQYFLDNQVHGITSYVYNPIIPDAVFQGSLEDRVEEEAQKRKYNQEWREIIYQMALDYYANAHDNDDFYSVLAYNNFQHYPTGKTGYENYYIDMQGFWRQLYDPLVPDGYFPKAIREDYPNEEDYKIALKREYWNKNVYFYPEALNFWIDFLDDAGEMEKYQISVIGDRPKSVNDSDVTAIYFRGTPTVLFVTSEEYIDMATNGNLKTGYTYIQLKDSMKNCFSISAQGKSAQDALDDLLYNYTYCIESINLTSIPIYYLQPNTRIFVKDDNSKINGEYIVSKISLPLTYNGMMQITATKAVSRIY